MSYKQSKTRVKKILAVVLAVITALTFTWAAYTDVLILRKTEDMKGSEKAISILFVGSSQVFVGNLPSQLQTIAKTHGVEIIYKDISRHGNRGGTLGELKDSAINEMQGRRFDYVVLQDQTRWSLNNRESLLDDIRILCDEARKNGAIPVLYDSAWAMRDGQPDLERLNKSTDVSQQAAEKNDAILIPAADAWVYAYQTLPGISLYTRFDPRGPHANKAGGFLTACVFAAVLFDMPIDEIPKNNQYKGTDAIDLAQAAWAFVNRE